MKPTLFLVSLALAATAARPAVPAGDDVKVTIGERETLLYHGDLGLTEFPDTAVSVVARRPYLKLIFAAGVSSCMVEGADLRSLNSPKRVLLPGPRGHYDGGYAGIGGVYAHRDGRLYAFYHAEDQEGMRKFGNGVPGYYSRIGAAVSDDGGRSFEKLGVAVSSPQEKDPKGLPDQGCGEMCVTPDGDGVFLHMYYADHSRVDGRGVQICLARARVDRVPPVPRAWMKYFNGKFKEDGLGGRETPVLSAASMSADATFPHVTWSKPMGLFVMVYSVVAYLEHPDGSGRGAPKKSGIYAAFSDDGIRWSGNRQLIRAFSVPFSGRELAWHPAVVWDDGDSMTGWLVYSYSPKWGYGKGGTPHYMVGRRISLRIETK